MLRRDVRPGELFRYSGNNWGRPHAFWCNERNNNIDTTVWGENHALISTMDSSERFHDDEVEVLWSPHAPARATKGKSIYLIGSLRNPEVCAVAEQLRAAGYDVFDDWMAAGPEADDYWQKYEKAKGLNFAAALKGYAAQHVFAYDKQHIDRCDIGVLVLPAGKSGHLELGYMIGCGKPGFILLPGEPERFDCMYNFAHGGAGPGDGVYNSLPDLIAGMEANVH